MSIFTGAGVALITPMNPDGSINYPPNNGAVRGTEKNVTLKTDTVVGRFGKIGPDSKFVT